MQSTSHDLSTLVADSVHAKIYLLKNSLAYTKNDCTSKGRYWTDVKSAKFRSQFVASHVSIHTEELYKNETVSVDDYICVCVCVCVLLGSKLSYKHIWLNNKDSFCVYNLIKILSIFRTSVLVLVWNSYMNFPVLVWNSYMNFPVLVWNSYMNFPVLVWNSYMNFPVLVWNSYMNLPKLPWMLSDLS